MLFAHLFDRKRPLRFGALLVFVVGAGTVGGYLAHEYILTSYRATSSLILDDPRSFRRAEALLHSSATIERFTKSRGLENDPAIAGLAEQFARGRNQPVKLDVTYPLTRADMRDVPDVLAREMFKDSEPTKKETDKIFDTPDQLTRETSKELKVRPTLNVSVNNIDSQEAARQQGIILAYVRDTLLRSAIDDMLQVNATDIQRLGAALISQISTDEWKVQSLARQIKEMQEIQEKYRSSAGDAISAPATRNAIQAPNGETGLMSPAGQLVGLETQRADLTEKLHIAVARQASVAVIEQYTASMLARLESEPDAAKFLTASLRQLDSLSTKSTDANTKFALDEARNGLREAFISIRETYVSLPSEPKRPVVYRAGPGVAASLGAGAMVGFVLWLMLLRLSHGMAAQRDDQKLNQGVTNLRPARFGERAR